MYFCWVSYAPSWPFVKTGLPPLDVYQVYTLSDWTRKILLASNINLWPRKISNICKDIETLCLTFDSVCWPVKRISGTWLKLAYCALAVVLPPVIPAETREHDETLGLLPNPERFLCTTLPENCGEWVERQVWCPLQKLHNQVVHVFQLLNAYQILLSVTSGSFNSREWHWVRGLVFVWVNQSMK